MTPPPSPTKPRAAHMLRTLPCSRINVSNISALAKCSSHQHLPTQVAREDSEMVRTVIHELPRRRFSVEGREASLETIEAAIKPQIPNKG